MKRFFIIVSAAFAVLILSWVALIGAVYAWGGVATVRVQDGEEGVNLYVPVPMALVDAAVTTTGFVVPNEEWLDLDVELGDWGPMIHAMLEELDELPDCTLVEVEDGAAHVRVYKEGGSLKVRVDEEDVHVKVSVPMRSARRTLSKVANFI
jgi:hypothetical protein